MAEGTSELCQRRTKHANSCFSPQSRLYRFLFLCVFATILSIGTAFANPAEVNVSSSREGGYVSGATVEIVDGAGNTVATQDTESRAGDKGRPRAYFKDLRPGIYTVKSKYGNETNETTFTVKADNSRNEKYVFVSSGGSADNSSGTIGEVIPGVAVATIDQILTPSEPTAGFASDVVTTRGTPAVSGGQEGNIFIAANGTGDLTRGLMYAGARNINAFRLPDGGGTQISFNNPSDPYASMRLNDTFKSFQIAGYVRGMEPNTCSIMQPFSGLITRGVARLPTYVMTANAQAASDGDIPVIMRREETQGDKIVPVQIASNHKSGGKGRNLDARSPVASVELHDLEGLPLRKADILFAPRDALPPVRPFIGNTGPNDTIPWTDGDSRPPIVGMTDHRGRVPRYTFPSRQFPYWQMSTGYGWNADTTPLNGFPPSNGSAPIKVPPLRSGGDWGFPNFEPGGNDLRSGLPFSNGEATGTSTDNDPFSSDRNNKSGTAGPTARDAEIIAGLQNSDFVKNIEGSDFAEKYKIGTGGTGKPGTIDFFKSGADWARLLRREERIQQKIAKQYKKLITEIGKSLNLFLDATLAYQDAFRKLQDASVPLKAGIDQYQKDRDYYQKVDLVIAVIQIVKGIGKLGVGVWKWATKPKTAEAIAETAAAAGGKIEGAAAKAETVVEQGTTVVDRARRTGIGTGTAIEGGGKAASGTGTFIDKAGDAASVVDDLPDFMKGVPKVELIVQKVDVAAEFGTEVAGLVKKYGINADEVLDAVRGEDGLHRLLAIFRAVANAKGLHSIPIKLESALANVIQTTQRAAAGDAVALEAIKSGRIRQQLITIVELGKKIGFTSTDEFINWLRSAATGFDDAQNGIGILYNAQQLQTLKYILLNGFDLQGLRAILGPLDNIAGQALAGSKLGATGVKTAAYGGAGASALGGAFGPGGTNSTSPRTGGTNGSKLSQAQKELAALAEALTREGAVDLSTIRQQFGGILSRVPTEDVPWYSDVGNFGYNFGAEMWNWFLNPTTAYSAWGWDVWASGAYLDLLTNHQDDFFELSHTLGDALSALRGLNGAINNAGLDNKNNTLGGKGVADLQGLLNDLNETYNSAGPKFQGQRAAELDERRAHIGQKIERLKYSIDGFKNIAKQLPHMIEWLDGLRYTRDANGNRTVRPGVGIFNPEIFIRLASVGVFVQSQSSQAFLQTRSAPVTVVRPPPKPPSKETKELLELTPDELRERLTEEKPKKPNVDIPNDAWDHLSPEQKKAVQEAGRTNVDRYWEQNNNYQNDSGYSEADRAADAEFLSRVNAADPITAN